MNEETRFQRPAPPPVVWAFALIFVGFELAFQLTAAVWPALDLRWEAYQRLAFFDILFEAWRHGIEAPATLFPSFATHALLHGGLLHLLMNGAIFLGLGGMIANSVGAARFLALFVGSAVGGALAFALIADANGPLVGASGGIFGFFGALKRWEWRWIRATGAPARRFWGTIAALTLVNVLLALAGPGGMTVAWQAHLGGFVAGWFLAPLVAPGRAGPSPI